MPMPGWGARASAREGVLVGAVVADVDGQAVVRGAQAQRAQQVQHRAALVPVHLPASDPSPGHAMLMLMRGAPLHSCNVFLRQAHKSPRCMVNNGTAGR